MRKAKERKTGGAKDFNKDFEDARQESRDVSGNVVLLMPQMDEAKILLKVREITTEFGRLKAEGKAINEQRKVCLEKIDACGLDRKEFKALVTLLEVDEEKRALKRRTRHLFHKAHGLPEQADLFGDAEEAAETTTTGSAALDAALGNGFLTEDELARNREIERDMADDRDAPEESDLGSFSRAEHDEQAALSARG